MREAVSTNNYNPVCLALEAQSELSSECSALRRDRGGLPRGGDI